MSQSIALLDEVSITPLHAWPMKPARDEVPLELRKKEGTALKRLWDEKHGTLTQARFATEILGRSAGYLPQFFKGRRPVTLQYARLFAKHLDCRIEDFSPRLASLDVKEQANVEWPFPNVVYEDVAQLEDWEMVLLDGVVQSWLLRNSRKKSGVASKPRGTPRAKRA